MSSCKTKFGLFNVFFFATGTFYLDEGSHIKPTQAETRNMLSNTEPAFQLWDWYAIWEVVLLPGQALPVQNSFNNCDIQNILNQLLTSVPLTFLWYHIKCLCDPCLLQFQAYSLPHLNDILRNWYEILSMIAKVLFRHQAGIWMCLGLMTKTVAWEMNTEKNSKQMCIFVAQRTRCVPWPLKVPCTWAHVHLNSVLKGRVSPNKYLLNMLSEVWVM